MTESNSSEEAQVGARSQVSAERRRWPEGSLMPESLLLSQYGRQSVPAMQIMERGAFTDEHGGTGTTIKPAGAIESNRIMGRDSAKVRTIMPARSRHCATTVCSAGRRTGSTMTFSADGIVHLQAPMSYQDWIKGPREVFIIYHCSNQHGARERSSIQQRLQSTHGVTTRDESNRHL